MDSTTRFLLGGALGAALGYLISQKNIEKALKALQVPSAHAPAPAAPVTAPVGVTELAAAAVPTAAVVVEAPVEPVAFTPTAVVEAPPAPVGFAPPVVEAPPAPVFAPEPYAPPRWEPMPEAAPAAVEAEPAEIAEAELAEVVEAPAVEVVEAPPAPFAEAPPAAVLEAPLVEVPIVEETVSAEEMAEALEADVEAPEAEVVVAREILEEPLPGSGWQRTAAPVVEEELLEDVLPFVPDELLAYPAPEVERLWPEPRETRPIPVWPEPVTEEPLVEEMLAVEPVVETPVVETPLVETAWPEVAEFEAPVVEAPASPLVQAPVAEELPVVDEASLAQRMPVAETAQIDDLKARIEETRRRIRRELEQPFVPAEEPVAAGADWTTSPAVPVIGEAVLSEGMPPEVAEAFIPDLELDAGVASAVAEPVDYDSMRSRIEVTRSRLKAKAFDAMMMGESALLGRDLEDTGRKKRRAVTSVDSEVDETIETNLREEED